MLSYCGLSFSMFLKYSLHLLANTIDRIRNNDKSRITSTNIVLTVVINVWDAHVEEFKYQFQRNAKNEKNEAVEGLADGSYTLQLLT